jgi:hypothetical protein
MADPSRFPRLELPFAVLGGCAGWLSATMTSSSAFCFTVRQSPYVAAFVATFMGAALGFVLRRACAGRKYAYALGAVDPSTRPHSDRWWRHAAVTLFAGSATGAIVASACSTLRDSEGLGATLGLVCTVLVLPVCFAVLSAARHAQRARLGSIVAESDRRAVWAILATTLGVATLESLGEWPAARAGHVAHPLPALVMAILAAVVVLFVWHRDLRARAHAREAASGIMSGTATADPLVPRVDLGLGDELAARVDPGHSPYRAQERVLLLLAGDPNEALAAMSRAVRRGSFSLGVSAVVLGVHVLAAGGMGTAMYAELRRTSACVDLFDSTPPFRERTVRP